MLRNKLFSIVICCLIMPVLFQASVANTTQKTENSIFEGKIIDSLVVDNRNIYDVNDQKYDNFLFRTANKLHIKTQNKIIKRDILLQQGEKYSQALADESERILRQRFVFYDAWIEKEVIEGDKLLVRVITIDRWSLGVGFNLNREGNENNLKLGVTEKNFLGQNRFVSYHYIYNSKRPNYSEFSTLDKRLFGKKLLTEVAFRTNPLDKFTSFALARPFYSLSQRFSFQLITIKKQGRVDYYDNDNIVSQLFYDGDRSEAEMLFRVGPYNQKYTYQLKYIYNYETNNSTHALNNIAQDSLYQGFQAGIGFSVYGYKIKQNIDSRNFREDFNSGVEMFLEYRKVTTLHGFHPLYHIVNFKIQKYLITKNTLTALSYYHIDWSNSGFNLRKKTNFNVKFYNQTTSQFMLATNFDYLQDKSSQDIDLITLGGSSGLRGTDKYYLSGNERLVINSEIRTDPFISILSFSIGGAVFADFANIIQSNEDFKLTNTQSTFGLGLRISFDRSSKNIVRIDFAYSKAKQWQFSFGTGQYFQANDHF